MGDVADPARAEGDLLQDVPALLEFGGGGSLSWPTGYRRLNHRYECRPRNCLAFLGLAAVLCCYRGHVRLTT